MFPTFVWKAAKNKLISALMHPFAQKICIGSPKTWLGGSLLRCTRSFQKEKGLKLIPHDFSKLSNCFAVRMVERWSIDWNVSASDDISNWEYCEQETMRIDFTIAFGHNVFAPKQGRIPEAPRRWKVQRCASASLMKKACGFNRMRLTLPPTNLMSKPRSISWFNHKFKSAVVDWACPETILSAVSLRKAARQIQASSRCRQSNSYSVFFLYVEKIVKQ